MADNTPIGKLLYDRLLSWHTTCIQLWPEKLQPVITIAFGACTIGFAASMLFSSSTPSVYVRAASVAGTSLIALQTIYMHLAKQMRINIDAGTAYSIALACTCLGAFAYASGLWMPEHASAAMPDTSTGGNDAARDIPKLTLFEPQAAERYGRHLFLALPILQGLVMSYFAFGVIGDKSADIIAKGAAKFAIACFAVHAAIIILISGFIKQLSLATDGPDQGDMNPILSLLAPVILALIGLVFATRTPVNGNGASARAAETVRATAIVTSTVITLTTLVLSYCRFTTYAPKGTGLGVVTTIVASIALTVYSFATLGHGRRDATQGS